MRLALSLPALSLLALTLGALAGCEDEQPPPTFRITFSAESDETPLEGVEISADGTTLGSTGGDGTLGVTLRGREGQVVTVGAACPEGHRELEDLPNLVLRSFRGVDPAAAERGIEMTIACAPAQRVAAVVVRATGDGDFGSLPVMYRGREIARTDDGGVAHLLLNLEPNTSFRVELDTSANEALRPQNPGATFTVPDRDDVFVYAQPFETRRRARVRRRRARPSAPMGPTLPMRIN